MAQFEVRTSSEPDRVVLALTGECDLATKDELALALGEAVTCAPVVVVDATELTFLDSSGIHALVTAHHATQRRGGRLYLVNAHGPVAGVLDLTGVGELLKPRLPHA